MTDNGLDLPLHRTQAASLSWLSRLVGLTGWRKVTFWLGVLLLGVILYLVTYSALSHNLAPSGADPGNWLSLAWSVSGEGARLASWSYPPLSFILLRALLAVFSPLVALKIYGLFAWLAAGAAVWWVLLRFLKNLPAWAVFGLVVLFTLAGYTTEMFAWGGYPQLLGLAFLAPAIPTLENWLVRGKRQDGVAAVLLSVGVIYTHHLLTASLPLFWLIVYGWTFVRQAWQRRGLSLRFAQAIGGSLLLALPAILVYWRYLQLLSGSPLDASGYSWSTLTQMVDFVFRGFVPLWIAVLLLATVAPFLARYRRLSASTFAFIFGTLVIGLGLWEIRFLQLLFVGITYGLGLLFDQDWSQPASGSYTRLRQGLLSLCILVILAGTLPQDVQRYGQATTYYQVASNDVIPGIEWLQVNSTPGSRVAVSKTHPDMMGWWVEGLAKRPALAATNLRWLSFQDERGYATIANLIFNPDTPTKRVIELLLSNHVQWLFIDKQNDPDRFQELISRGVVASAYEDQRVLILQVLQPNAKLDHLKALINPSD